MFVFYIVAFFAYMFIRITKTLSGLGSYLIYGIFVLAVEVLGATTTFIYGVSTTHVLPQADGLLFTVCMSGLTDAFDVDCRQAKRRDAECHDA